MHTHIKLLITLSLTASLTTLTLADEQHATLIQKIGIVGCLKPNKAPALLNYTESIKPDLMLWVGDNIYADAKTTTRLDERYAQLAARDGFKELRKIETMATWDDHDYGLNNSGDSNPIKNKSKAIFSKFWNLPSYVDTRSGIYHAKIFGPENKRLQVIMLDARFAKSKDRILGAEQWQWLGAQLEKPADLRLVVTGQQVLLPKETRFETWTKNGQEQAKLFDLIKEKKTEGVVFITGDQHYGEVLKIPQALGYDAWEFMFSGVNQDEKSCPVAANVRVGPAAHSKHKTGSMQIKWSKDPQLTFQVHDLDGKLLLEQSISKSELSF